MKKILFSWIGDTDLRASQGDAQAGIGPVAATLQKFPFDQIILLSNYCNDPRIAEYLLWLDRIAPGHGPLAFREVSLSSPIHFGEIYSGLESLVAEDLRAVGRNAQHFFLLSPGTPAMAAVWILLGKGRFSGARFLQSTKDGGPFEAEIPFDIATEFLPSLSKVADERLQQLGAELPPVSPAFEKIVHVSPQMQEVVARARVAATRDVPVLIEGETGTGKELFARAIHAECKRRKGLFVAVNCGAIPHELFEAEFFGHKKGAFTGADRDRAGYFESADGGVLFLDEIGELPLESQVKILRVLQEKQVTRLGEAASRPIDVRIVAATNRDLAAEVGAGRFRSDLFYRLAIATLRLPPLRERRGDLTKLIDVLLDEVNQQLALEPGYRHKKISPNAKKILLQHAWPGNVRELGNTLLRICVWTPGNKIEASDVEANLLLMTGVASDSLLSQPLGNSFNLEELLGVVAKSYIERALKESGGVKKRAAELLGFEHYQTLSNWMEKYGVN